MTANDVEVYKPPPLEEASPLDRSLALVGPAFALAERLAKSNLVPATYRGKPEDILAAFLYGDELGLKPMVALNEIFVERGRVGMTAKLMRAVVQRDGHDLWIEDQNDVMVKVGGQRAGSSHPSFVTWTMDDAKRAGLDKKDNWKGHPKAMLLARATSQLCRIIGSDALAGISYSIEEIRDDFTEDEEPAEVELGERPAGTPAAPKADNVRKLPRKRAAKKAAAVRPSRRTEPEDPLDDEDELDNYAADTSSETPAAPPSKRAQMLAIRVTEALGRTPTREERLELLAALLGKPVPTSKDLSSEEVDRVLVELGRIDAGELGWDTVNGLVEVAVLVDEEEEAQQTGETSPEPTTGAHPDPPAPSSSSADVRLEQNWDDNQWRAYLKAKGVRVAQLMKEAQRLAGELEVDPPGSLVDVAAITNVHYLGLLRDYVEENAK